MIMVQFIYYRKNLDQRQAMNRTNAYHYQENVRSNIETIQHLHMQVSVFACLVDQRLRLLVNIAMSDIPFFGKDCRKFKKCHWKKRMCEAR